MGVQGGKKGKRSQLQATWLNNTALQIQLQCTFRKEICCLCSCADLFCLSRYFTYYIPFFAWIRQYRWVHLQGDIIAALTMSSFYIPMALSYASNLAHVPAINGLYSFVFNPIIYAILGSCPQMVVGPEAAGSLLVGSVVRSSVDSGRTGEGDDEMHARVAGVVTGMAGATIFIAGLTRLGFLDSVLSRPFLRGFISAIGFVILVDQLIPELGLAALAEEAGVSHGSSIDKLRFLFGHINQASGITSAVTGISFAIIMIFRYTASGPFCGDNTNFLVGK
jgi:MFS superfamily sulfate permease-like transporter